MKKKNDLPSINRFRQWFKKRFSARILISDKNADLGVVKLGWSQHHVKYQQSVINETNLPNRQQLDYRNQNGNIFGATFN